MSRRNRSNSGHRIPPPSSEPRKPQEQEENSVEELQVPSPTTATTIDVEKETVDACASLEVPPSSEPSKPQEMEEDRVEDMQGPSPTTTTIGVKTETINTCASMEVSGRERLKRHRTEVAGHVWVPDIWGQEDLLKDWIDCSAFNSSLVPNGLMSARAALIEENRRANSGRLRIENRC
ncbi:PREDICTED: uncharacterized protein LOC104607675 [Nelumbo nucifera]|uniref:Uncharacterized protein LOC104607675 n=2 Tax=Nelumbo nucifera TaxID=4432 RepID=A0A1U8AUA6_NELNU|nr:PREDICTED: uncharacterized protein LOC104607675 [Nelumbo nucifera]DAD28831.1 TPA_asm: hypothetical protein HUJ06_030299 [Nelumbo nucifera]